MTIQIRQEPYWVNILRIVYLIAAFGFGIWLARFTYSISPDDFKTLNVFVIILVSPIILYIEYRLNTWGIPYTDRNFIRYISEGWTSMIILLIAMILFIMIFTSYIVYSDHSFHPNVQRGDFLLGSSTAYTFDHPKQGDLIQYYPPNASNGWVARIIGTPGDTIAQKNRRLYVNRLSIPGTAVLSNKEDTTYTIRLREGYFLAKADRDSVYFYLPRSWIGQKYFFRLTPIKRMGLLGKPDFLVPDKKQSGTFQEQLGQNRNQVIWYLGLFLLILGFGILFIGKRNQLFRKPPFFLMLFISFLAVYLYLLNWYQITGLNKTFFTLFLLTVLLNFWLSSRANNILLALPNLPGVITIGNNRHLLLRQGSFWVACGIYLLLLGYYLIPLLSQNLSIFNFRIALGIYIFIAFLHQAWSHPPESIKKVLVYILLIPVYPIWAFVLIVERLIIPKADQLALKADIYEENLMLGEALQLREEALQIRPDNIDNLLIILDLCRKQDLIEKELEYQLNFHDRRTGLYQNWNLSHIGWLYQKLRKYRLALGYQLQAEAIEHTDAWNLGNIGWSYDRLNDLEKAMSYYLRAIALNPNDPWVLKNIGSVHYDKKEFEQALNYFLKIEKLTPDDPNNIKNICLTLANLDRDEEALEKFQKLKQLDFYDFNFLLHLTQTYHQSGKIALLKDIFEAFKDRFPDDPAMWRELGWNHHKIGELEEAEKCLQRAYELAPEELNNLWDLSVIYWVIGNENQGDQLFEKLPPNFYENNLENLVTISKAKFLANNLQEAKIYLQKYQNLQTDEPLADMAMLATYIELGLDNLEEAKTLLLEAKKTHGHEVLKNILNQDKTNLEKKNINVEEILTWFSNQPDN